MVYFFRIPGTGIFFPDLFENPNSAPAAPNVSDPIERFRPTSPFYRDLNFRMPRLFSDSLGLRGFDDDTLLMGAVTPYTYAILSRQIAAATRGNVDAFDAVFQSALNEVDHELKAYLRQALVDFNPTALAAEAQRGNARALDRLGRLAFIHNDAAQEALRVFDFSVFRESMVNIHEHPDLIDPYLQACILGNDSAVTLQADVPLFEKLSPDIQEIAEQARDVHPSCWAFYFYESMSRSGETAEVRLKARGFLLGTNPQRYPDLGASLGNNLEAISWVFSILNFQGNRHVLPWAQGLATEAFIEANLDHPLINNFLVYLAEGDQRGRFLDAMFRIAEAGWIEMMRDLLLENRNGQPDVAARLRSLDIGNLVEIEESGQKMDIFAHLSLLGNEGARAYVGEHYSPVYMQTFERHYRLNEFLVAGVRMYQNEYRRTFNRPLEVGGEAFDLIDLAAAIELWQGLPESEKRRYLESVRLNGERAPLHQGWPTLGFIIHAYQLNQVSQRRVPLAEAQMRRVLAPLFEHFNLDAQTQTILMRHEFEQPIGNAFLAAQNATDESIQEKLRTDLDLFWPFHHEELLSSGISRDDLASLAADRENWTSLNALLDSRGFIAAEVLQELQLRKTRGVESRSHPERERDPLDTERERPNLRRTR